MSNTPSPLSRREFLRISAGGASLAAGVWSVDTGLAAADTADTGGARRPNILLIVAEDMGPHVGCYGDATVPTPHVDGLARRGVCVQNAYVTQASCSPSRSSILTGLYPHETNQLGLAHLGYTSHRGIPSLPRLLKARGYHTGIQGKLHVSPARDYPFDFRGNGHSKDVRAYRASARKFLDRAAGTPWFLYVNFADAHKPFAHQYKGLPEKPVTAADVKKFPVYGEISDPLLNEEIAGYYNGIQRVDAGVGMLLDLLDKKGLAENTLVLFIGDHGPPMSRGKTTTYEFGTRIPFLLRWPGVARAGLRLDALVSTVDILPTLLTAAGGELPFPLSGVPLQPLLRGQVVPWRNTVMTEWHAHGPGFQPQRAIRDDRFKLILNLRPGVPKDGYGVDGCVVPKLLKNPRYAGSRVKRVFDMLKSPPPVELYDLKKDPIEYENLAGKPEYTEVEARLKRELQAWRVQTHDPFLDPAVFDAYLKHYREFVRTYPAERKKVKPDKRGRRIVPIRMQRFQEDWAEIVKERYRPPPE